MAGMRVSLPGLFAQLVRQCPDKACSLEEIEQHLRETIRGEHTLQEFAEHYCLVEAAIPSSPESAPMSTDRDILYNTRDQLRSNPQTLGIRVSSDHYLWLAARIELLESEVRATKAAVVLTLGGTVEGLPTQSINYLQRIRQLQDALEKSIVLQSHYARILNAADGGKRMQFHNGEDWIARLSSLK